MGDKSGLVWPQIVSQSYRFCSPMPIDPFDLDSDREREILIISARPAYPDEAKAYLDMLSI